MKLMFLGTGTSQGVPVITCKCVVCRSSDSRDKRLRTSALIETDDGRNILIDIGPDFRQQMLREEVTHIDAVLITHAHRDHVAGIDDIRAFNYVQQQPLDLYGNSIALNTLKRDYGYIFSEHEYPGLPEATLHEVSADEPFMAAGVEVVPIAAMHKDLTILGYRIGDIAYVTDANYIAPQELEKLMGVKVMVLNALRREHHWSHYSLPEALSVIERVGPERAYLTHVSHEMGLHEEVSRTLPDWVCLAYDGLTVEI